MDALLVVIAVNLVSFLVNEGRVPADDCAVEAGMLCDLTWRVSPRGLAEWCWARGQRTSLYAAGPFDDVRRPFFTNLAVLLSLLPRLVVYSVESSESSESAGRHRGQSGATEEESWGVGAGGASGELHTIGLSLESPLYGEDRVQDHGLLLGRHCAVCPGGRAGSRPMVGEAGARVAACLLGPEENTRGERIDQQRRWQPQGMTARDEVFWLAGSGPRLGCAGVLQATSCRVPGPWRARQRDARKAGSHGTKCVDLDSPQRDCPTQPTQSPNF